MTEPDDLDAPIARIERQLDDLSRAVDSLADLLISLRNSLVECDRKPAAQPPRRTVVTDGTDGGVTAIADGVSPGLEER
ncbi:hypothetical protein [Prauserella muralis]|uniref:hypothetical protein n=1 Tax=Prauserella muralis TaxID=588067 RepID=UPI0011BE5817|nr:hypothetical protein [Prauserella muralis]